MSEEEFENMDNFENNSTSELIQRDLAQLASTLEHPEQELDEDFLREVGNFFKTIDHERKYLMEEPLAHDQKLVLFHVLVKIYAEVKDWKRKDGTSTFFSHWIGTAKYLVRMTGRTGVNSILIALLHDWIEDLKSKQQKSKTGNILFLKNKKTGFIRQEKQNPEYLLSKILDVKDILEHLDKYDPEKIEEVRHAVIKAVKGLTKIKKKDREETKRGYFVRQLRTILDAGLRVPYAKLSDRGDNIDTISAHNNPDRERDIMKETEQINLAMARELRLTEVVSHMTDACMEFFNPQLAEQFNTFAEERLQETLVPFEKDIIKRVQEHTAVRNVTIRIKNLADYTSKTDIAFEDLDFNNLGIRERDPMFEIIVTTRSEKGSQKENERKDVAAHLHREFGDDPHAVFKSLNTPTDDRMPVSPWTEVTVSNPKYPTQIHFIIRSEKDQRKLKRGLVADYFDETPKHIREHIAAVLSSTERELRQSKDERDAARKEFLNPTITVFTKRGVPKELPLGATGLDLATIVHKDILRGLQAMLKADSPVSRGPEQLVSIFDPLEDDKLYIFDSCLTEDDPRPDEVKVHPSWLLFCQRNTARTLRKFLRHPLHLKKREEQTTYLMNLGLQYMMMLSSVTGLTYQRLNNLLEKKNPNSDWPQIKRDVGCGKINPLLQITENIQQPRVRKKELEGKDFKYRQWDIKVELINKEDQIKEFQEVLNREGGINMQMVEQPDEGEVGIFKLRLEVDADISTYDFFRRLIRTSFDYQISVNQNLRYRTNGNT